jgi:8-oxo-dGTP pyrophosphatase MutT (NUDIX family)
MTEQKRHTAGYVPVHDDGEQLFVFLQKKDDDAPFLTGEFAFFGGGIEGEESPYEGMVREAEEELTYTPQEAEYLTTVENDEVLMHVYFERVSAAFADTVSVQEGEYGAFYSIAEAITELDMRQSFIESLQALQARLQ